MLVTVWVSSLFGLYVSRTPGLKPCGQRLLGFGLQVFWSPGLRSLWVWSPGPKASVFRSPSLQSFGCSKMQIVSRPSNRLKLGISVNS